MMALFSNLTFLHPWILAGLGALPLLWFLLRVTPPMPRLVEFPATRFLQGLTPEKQTPDHTPWWILLLRLLVAALVLFALAHPVYNPAGQLTSSQAVRLVIDNGWASAQTWDKQMQAAIETLNQAGREDKEIYILTTAAQPGAEQPVSHGPLAAPQAATILKAIKPSPWSADNSVAAAYVKEHAPDDAVHSYWFSHGLDEGDFTILAQALADQGDLSVFTPTPENLPLVLELPQGANTSLQVAVDAPAAIPDALSVTVNAMTEDGRVIDRQTQELKPDALPATLKFDIPEALRNEITQFKIANRVGTGAVYVLDERFRKHAVGIIGPADEADTKPFIEGIFYLQRALEPYATLTLGNAEDLIAQKPSMIILADIGSMPAATLNALEKWVKGGGLLLRFAGPNMTGSDSKSFLVPVPLRAGNRSTEGSLSWEKPPKLVPFPGTSPFFGIPITEDITVRQQVLAEPAQDMEKKTWASLEDGTPLITAAPLDKGLLVMVHTTASPEWSDLALSGVFVEILRRLSGISGTSGAALQTGGFLEPLWVFDGFGTVINPESWARSIPAADFAKTAPGPDHPPGLYGHGGFQEALNIGDHVGVLKVPAAFPSGARVQHYGTNYERDLMPLVLYAALALLLCDWLIMVILSAGLRLIPRFAVIVLLMSISFPAFAQEPDYEQDTKYADGLYLAYIQTGDPSIDAISLRGLENLAAVLTNRTSAEPAGVAALNPETDELGFFPLIYWPVSAAQAPLSDQTVQNIQSYLDRGGTILFDTREENASAGSLAGTPNIEHLRQLVGALNIPPLQPINKDHVLGRSFYLLDTFPGLYTGGTLWVESKSVNGRDGVSSVIIGSHDWAAAWAAGRADRSTFSGGSRQQELSYRFGVNLLMYALTGNYKADQVHVPHILERLGQ
jgi:hypothetical protein